MFCVKCGTKLTEGSVFCHNCGAAAVNVNVNNSHTSPSPSSNPPIQERQPISVPVYTPIVFTGAAGLGAVPVRAAKSRTKLAVIVTTLLVAIVTVGIILYNVFFASDPLKTVNKFIDAVNEKDVKGAISCMDPSVQKTFDATSNLLSNFIGGVQLSDIADLAPGLFNLAKSGGMQADLKLNNAGVVSKSINGNNATVVLNIESLSKDDQGKAKTEKFQAVFTLKKFDEGWRITNVK